MHASKSRKSRGGRSKCWQIRQKKSQLASENTSLEWFSPEKSYDTRLLLGLTDQSNVMTFSPHCAFYDIKYIRPHSAVTLPAPLSTSLQWCAVVVFVSLLHLPRKLAITAPPGFYFEGTVFFICTGCFIANCLFELRESFR